MAMRKSASARWTRRVGSLHWETADDEFLHFSSDSTSTSTRSPLDTAVDTTTAAPEHGTSVTLTWELIIILCGLISMGRGLVRRRWHDKKRIPTTKRVQGSLSSGRAFPWEQKCGERPAERKKKDRETSMSQFHNTGAVLVSVDKMHDSETCSTRNEADTKKRPDQVTPILTDNIPPNYHDNANAGNESKVIELARLETPPLLVADRAEATVMTTTGSNSLGLTSFVSLDNDTTNKTFSLRECPASIVSRHSIVAAAEDATDLAQKIRVTQAVFFQHGLDPNLASEWAMRRQASDLSEASQRKLEDYKFALDTISRHEDRQVSERQLREMRASMEYDKDWLEKIHRAREKCWHACLYSFFLSVVVSLVVETYWNVPEHTSALSFLAFILGCNCEESDLKYPYDDSSTWSMTWFSEYCTGALYSWTPSSLSHPLCYLKCIGWRLLPPSVIQVGLHFCRVPTIFHQASTMAMVVSLLSLQLAVVIREWLWLRVLPLLVVTFCSVAGVWTLTSNMVDSLQRSQNVRKQLAEALIFLDSLHSNVFLAHFCAVGLLLAVSPKLTS